MIQNKVRQSAVEDVLEFCVNLSRRTIVSGANLERVTLAIERICHAYGLSDVSIFLLSTHISLSAKDGSGTYASRQATIPSVSIHLERLKKLNRLSYTVVETTPAPEELDDLLEEASNVNDYKDWMILLAQICAMNCLCLIFGGGLREILPVSVVTVVMHYIMRLLEKPGLDKIVTNALTMWIATVVTFLLIRIGTSNNGAVILITVSMLVIPGIPLVNAMRNLLCGNEMNGILQMAKVTVETLALAAGIYVAIVMFGQRVGINDTVVTPLDSPILLILLSFCASVSFGAVNRIPPHDLWRAGLGGALTRIVLLILMPFTSRIVYISISAMVASLYAELLATRRKDPSTYFVYPSIVPLIPGDLFYYTIVGLYLKNLQVMEIYGYNCILTLAGMSIGFVLSSVIAHYVRKRKHAKLIHKAKA